MSMMPYFVPTRFVWRFGGKQVHLCGSFTRWVETVPMIPVDQSPGMFAVLVHLPPGYHQYKFIVDGEWRHDETQPSMPDPLGNVNNWLYVRQPDAAGAVPIGMHMPGTATHASGASSSNVSESYMRLPHDRQQHAPGPGHAGGGSVARGGALDKPAGGIPPQHASALAAAYGSPVASDPIAAPANTRLPRGSGHSIAAVSRQAAAVQNSPPADLADLGLNEDSAVLAPIAIQEEEPVATRKKVRDFLASHTAYELIPESGKVVLIDVDFSVRKAFHALSEQGIASAPLWDRAAQDVVGMISASDFIETLKQLRDTASSGGALTDSEMDAHTIRATRLLAAAAGAPSRPLVACHENDSFATVVRSLVENRCSMAPIMSGEPAHNAAPVPQGAAAGRPGDPPAVLHVTSLSGVLASLMRHFRASWSSLPLLAQPLASMPLGSWSPDSPIGRQGQALSAEGRAVPTTVTPIHTIQPDAPLTMALSMLMEGGVSALPVVDGDGALLDVYARSDITLLTRGCAYLRLQLEDMSVAQALALAGSSGPLGHSASEGRADGGQSHARPPASKRTRLYVCTRQDQLRVVLERLSMPSVRRVIVVHPETSKVEGIISLSDVARFLFL